MMFRPKQFGIFEGLVVLILMAGLGFGLITRITLGLAVQSLSSNNPTSATSGTAAPDIIESGVPQDGIPVITQPIFVPATQASEELDGAGSGLVLVRGLTARFYPYQILAWHEVVHDTIANMPVAVTYCALCNVGVVYDRRIEGGVLNFGVSGKLEGLDSLLYDKGTGSLWSQVTGEALSGPLKSTRLTQVPSTVMSLRDFVAQYPRGQVLSKFTGFVRDYDTLAYGDYATMSGGDKVIAQKGLLHPKTTVVGIVIDGKPKAYPLDLLDKNTITDLFVGTRIQILHDSGRVLFLNSKTGVPIPTQEVYWFLWQAWHPDTLVYR